MSTTLATPCTATEFEKMRLIYVASYISNEMWFGAHKDGTWGYPDVGLQCPVCIFICIFFLFFVFKHTLANGKKQKKPKKKHRK